MLLEERISLMTRLGNHLSSNDDGWTATIERAGLHNGWFTPEYVRLAVSQIVEQLLQPEKLKAWLAPYPAFSDPACSQPEVGVVMAGNIPLVGFHDFLSVFLSGCRLRIRLSGKDTMLWEELLRLLTEWAPEFPSYVHTAEQLKGCDAYIATGSNNSARYFSYYFGKYPNIIRRNRTSVAVLTGQESPADLVALSADICSYFGLGCRNVTKIFVPEGYDFIPLLRALDQYAGHMEYAKYKNNYDYQLALYLLNKISYMSSQAMLLVPSQTNFAPISVLHYDYYSNQEQIAGALAGNEDIQCVVAGTALPLGSGGQLPVVAFGKTQAPTLTDYADGVNTLDFLQRLKKM